MLIVTTLTRGSCDVTSVGMVELVTELTSGSPRSVSGLGALCSDKTTIDDVFQKFVGRPDVAPSADGRTSLDHIVINHCS